MAPEGTPDTGATRCEAIVHEAHRRRGALLVTAMVMDALALFGLEAQDGSRAYFAVLVVLFANLWVVCVGSDRRQVTIGADGIAAGRSFVPFSEIDAVVTPFRRPGHFRLRLKDGRSIAYSAPLGGELVRMRTRLLQRLGAHRNAHDLELPPEVDAGAIYRRASSDAALWRVLESPATHPGKRARAALRLAPASPDDRMRMHEIAIATAHPALRALLLAAAGHAPLSPRATRKLLTTLDGRISP